MEVAGRAEEHISATNVRREEMMTAMEPLRVYPLFEKQNPQRSSKTKRVKDTRCWWREKKVCSGSQLRSWKQRKTAEEQKAKKTECEGKDWKH